MQLKRSEADILIRLKKYILPYGSFICLTVLIKLLGALLELLIPSLMEIILEELRLEAKLHQTL